MKPSDRINQIYEDRLQHEKKSGQVGSYIPGAAERLLESIITYLDEKDSEKDGKE